MSDAVTIAIIECVECRESIECEYGIIGIREILIIFFLELWLSYFRLWYVLQRVALNLFNARLIE